MSGDTSWSRFVTFMRAHRRRFQLALIAVFVVAIVLTYSDAYPREVTISVPLGEHHSEVTEARIDITQQRETVRSIIRHFPDGAPSSVRDTVELSPGEYDVSVTLIDHHGVASRRSGRVVSPSDGVVRLSLEES